MKIKFSQDKITKKKYEEVKDMDQITVKEIQQLTETCLSNLKSDELYRLRNDAKLRAVNSSKSYDEFKWDLDTIKFLIQCQTSFPV